ncbi:hypothetical protein ACWGPT_18410 [Pseudorhizobium sp. NPDC055634]
MTDLLWKLVIKGLKSKIDPDRKRLMENVLREQAGEEVPLRTARRGFLLMALDALGGRPRLVAVHGDGVVVMMALEDLVEVLAEPAPTLAEVLATASVGSHALPERWSAKD